MNIVSTTIEWLGIYIKVENNKIYLPAYGTTAVNQNMHWTWQEIPLKALKDNLQQYLKDQKLI